MVFNTNTIIQLIIAAIPALIAMGIAKLMDGDGTRWAEYAGAITLIIVDALWRLAAVAGGDEEGEEGEASDEEEDDSAHGPLALVLPSGGGHIMFLPNWLIGGLVIYGLYSGFLS